MSKYWFMGAAVWAALSCAAPAARADSLKIKALGPTALGQSVSITHPSSGGSPTTYGGFAGFYAWEKQSGDGPIANGTFQTFCIELTENFSTGSVHTVQYANPQDAPDPGNPLATVGHMGLAKANLLSELFGRFFAAVDTAKEAAAFQVAVWEIVFDTGLKLGAGQGQVYVNNAGHLAADKYGGIAQSYLDALDGTGPHTHLLALSKVGFQDQIVPNPVPAPPGLVLAGIGFLGLMGWRGRRTARS